MQSIKQPSVAYDIEKAPCCIACTKEYISYHQLVPTRKKPSVDTNGISYYIRDRDGVRIAGISKRYAQGSICDCCGKEL